MDGEDTGDIGHYLYNMIDGSRIQFISGRPSDRQRQYADNGAFDGTALMIQNPAVSDAGDMIVAGENGLLAAAMNAAPFWLKRPDSTSIE